MEPLTELEVQCAVRQLATNKARRPDCIPNKFTQQAWPVLQNCILRVFDNFNNLTVDLTQTNKATIVLVPKCENPNSVTDYRTISMIKVLPKLISNVLANRSRE